MAQLVRIEQKASELALRFGGNKGFVDVEEIAKFLGLEIREHDLGVNVSGVLFVENGIGTIGINPEQSLVRRRFTLAHEIGHFILHRFDKDLFVDEKNFKVFKRDHKSSTGQLKQEREANAFAAALLMPKKLLIEKIDSKNFDLGDENGNIISDLSDEFKVSTQAMTFRISNLNLF